MTNLLHLTFDLLAQLFILANHVSPLIICGSFFVFCFKKEKDTKFKGGNEHMQVLRNFGNGQKSPVHSSAFSLVLQEVSIIQMFGIGFPRFSRTR